MSHLLLFMRHQQQNWLKNLIKSLDYYLFEVKFLVESGHFGLDLLSEKHEEKLQPFKNFEFSVALAFWIGHFNEDRKELIDKVYAYRLLKRIVIKFLLNGKLKAVQAFINIVFYFLIADHV